MSRQSEEISGIFKSMLKSWYSIIFISIAVYGFICPYLVSSDNGLFVITGFLLAFLNFGLIINRIRGIDNE